MFDFKLYFENRISFIKKNLKLLLFILIFLTVWILYNKNIPNLNYILKRGVILEYNVKKDLNADLINREINSKIKTFYVKNDGFYDEKYLEVAIALKPNSKKENLINEVSDIVFENDNFATLNSISSYKNKYNDKYAGFLKFLEVLFFSFGCWMILLYLIYDFREINQKFLNNIKDFCKKRKEKTILFIKNTKQKGIKYFFQKLILDEPVEEQEEEKDVNYLKEIINTLVFVVVVVVLIRYFIGELRWIPSGSMRPTILEHDRVFVEKLKYPTREINRGDILVFYPPEVKLSSSPLAILSRYSGILCKDLAYIKRVIGMPNDKFEVKFDPITAQYAIYINDKKLNEPYIISKTDWTPCREDMNCGPFVIPENKYFMMGDNRGNSQDSRFWGFLDKSRVIGRANFMFWPISRINLLKDTYLELNKDLKNNKERFIVDRY